ncbi:unnamed protein product [Moneuplotes crassus]|uniref:Uncharacterized protein n=1 Tax=Euplotes crassus TaxID=5936 RepID=A0AAD1U9B0_EUPCR|nr:unnamed protein product [Moneuplotes crassus]
MKRVPILCKDLCDSTKLNENKRREDLLESSQIIEYSSSHKKNPSIRFTDPNIIKHTINSRHRRDESRTKHRQFSKLSRRDILPKQVQNLDSDSGCYLKVEEPEPRGSLVKQYLGQKPMNFMKNNEDKTIRRKVSSFTPMRRDFKMTLPKMPVLQNPDLSKKIKAYDQYFCSQKPKHLNNFRKNLSKSDQKPAAKKQELVDLSKKESQNLPILNSQISTQDDTSMNNYEKSSVWPQSKLKKDYYSNPINLIHSKVQTSRVNQSVSLLIEKDPLNRDVEIAFKKQSIRVNPRVKVSLYSPSSQLGPKKFTSLIQSYGSNKPGIFKRRKQNHLSPSLQREHEKYLSIEMKNRRDLNNSVDLYKPQLKSSRLIGQRDWSISTSSRKENNRYNINSKNLKVYEKLNENSQNNQEKEPKSDTKKVFKEKRSLRLNTRRLSDETLSNFKERKLGKPRFPVKPAKVIKAPIEPEKSFKRGVVYRGERFYELDEIKKLIHFKHLDCLHVDSDSEI